jgi:DNA polymerase elongation subunit (family B)
MKILTFDIETRNKIPTKAEKDNPSLRNKERCYCSGWDDYLGMGISFLGAHTSWDNKITFFDNNNLDCFNLLCAEADIITGYNILAFDIRVLKATLQAFGYKPMPSYAEKIYDIFQDIRSVKKSSGWKLNDVAKATLGFSKNSDGAEAPDLWQTHQLAKLINYLYQDVYVEAMLFKHILEHGEVSNGVKTIQLPGIKKWQTLNDIF